MCILTNDPQAMLLLVLSLNCNEIVTFTAGLTKKCQNCSNRGVGIQKIVGKPPSLYACGWELNDTVIDRVMLRKTAYNLVRFGDQKSDRPFRVAFVDNFSTKDVDINGDGVPDLSHGDVVVRTARAFNPDIEPIRFDVGVTPDDSAQQGHVKKLIQLHRLCRGIVDGNKPVDAVNMSVISEMRLADITGPSSQPVDAQSIVQVRPLLVNAMLELNQLARYWTLRLMEGLVESGVPVYVSAGNSGKDYFAVENLAQGVTNVGATNAKGEKTPYTGDNGLVNRFAQGTFNITPTAEGFDFNGDDVPEVLNQEVSATTAMPEATRFVGKAFEQVFPTDDDLATVNEELGKGAEFARIPLVRDRLFQLSMLATLFEPVRMFNHPRELGLVIPQGELIGGFTVNRQGRIVYDPDESGRPNTINHFWGTSFSSPAALGQDSKSGKIVGPRAGQSHAILAAMLSEIEKED